MSDQWENPGGWERFSRKSGRQHPAHGGSSKPSGPPAWAAGALIALGVLLFAGNLGLLPFHNVWVFWPMFPIAAGIGQVLHPRNSTASVWGIALIIFGASFLLSNLGIMHFRSDHDGSPIAVLLIVFGFVAFMRLMRGHDRRRSYRSAFAMPRSAPAAASQATVDYENSLHDFVLLGALKRKLESSSFAGGELTSVFGNIEIDLRRALISSPTNSVMLNTTAVFGSIKLRVPQNWRVHVSGVSVLGNFEDKTIPPNIGPAAAVLVITGISIFSSVEIED